MDESAICQLDGLVRRYPYFHAARILYLSALYQSQSASFDVELRRGASLLPDRNALFRLFEEKSFQPQEDRHVSLADRKREEEIPDLTGSLIDTFLSSLPKEQKPHRHTKVDASVDYMAYLMQMEETKEEEQSSATPSVTTDNPQKEDHIIDDFLNGHEEGRIVLDDQPEKELAKPELVGENASENNIFTEALARIYIKQGKYERAIEIIRRLSLKYPKKNRYFADQIRFLEKLIINNNNKKV